MKIKMFTVFDSKVGAYLQPFFMQSTGAAMRAFEDSCNDPQMQFNKHPADFTLFEIGEYDDSDASVILLENKISLVSALECLAVKESSPVPLSVAKNNNVVSKEAIQ